MTEEFYLYRDADNNVIECESCGSEVPTIAVEASLMEPDYVYLCNLCYSTNAGSTVQKPGDDARVLRTVAGVGNAILSQVGGFLNAQERVATVRGLPE